MVFCESCEKEVGDSSGHTSTMEHAYRLGRKRRRAEKMKFWGRKEKA